METPGFKEDHISQIPALQIFLKLGYQYFSPEEARYATNSTPEKFWSKWQEKFESENEEKAYRSKLFNLKNSPLTLEQKQSYSYI